MEHVGQGRLDQFPAGNALDGPGQLWRQPVELVLHQHSLKGLKESGKGDISLFRYAAKCPTWPPAKQSLWDRQQVCSHPAEPGKHHYGYEFIMAGSVGHGGGGQFAKCKIPVSPPVQVHDHEGETRLVDYSVLTE